mmetsp:Transcript_13640/g.44026  ORF Transcript_13640/g.44026 Transcript_13640/m.44026 type:complete len:232 (-) Transcript_13640:87-782(-)
MAPQRRYLSAALAVAVAAAWQAPAAPFRRSGVVVQGGRTATPLGRTSTGAGKAKTVESVAADLGDAMLAFTVDGTGMEIKVLDDLRDKLPETSKARMVKNTLMKRAGEASGWDAALVEQVDDALLTRSNLWIFAPESDLKASLTAYEGWVKDNGLKETQGIKGGLFEGEVLDAKKVAAIKDLPTLPELMTRLAVGINMAGAQGIAKSINLAKGGPRGIAIRLKKVVDEEKL